MLTLVALIVALIAAVGIIGILFSFLLSQHTRSQYDVDALSLSAAKTINVGDRVGQMNQLVARSRELVYTTRQNQMACEQQGLEHLGPVLDQMMNEAYSSQALVEFERKNLIEITSKDVRQVALDHNLTRNTKSNSFLPWLKTFEPDVLRVDVGFIDKGLSNVRSLTAIDELADFDRRSGFVETKSELFKANINAKLPSPDDDLTFKFSSVPALVEGSVAPPRIANPSVFKSFGTVVEGGKIVTNRFDQIPQAVQVYTKMDLAVDAEELNKQAISIDSIGVTGGAVSPPE